MNLFIKRNGELVNMLQDKDEEAVYYTNGGKREVIARMILEER